METICIQWGITGEHTYLIAEGLTLYVLIGLLKHGIEAQIMYALPAFLLVLGALRIASIFMHQKEMDLESSRNSFSSVT